MPTERKQPGGTEMNRKILLLIPALLLAAAGNAVMACEYKAGETKYLDYAVCRYGEDSLEVVQLPEDATWETCIYYLQAFRPEKLLAVTKVTDGKEMVSINDRSQIGNPCYMAKQVCDKALRDSQQ
jgi:hypothetical protein